MTDPTDLTPAEQAAYGPIYEAAHSIDHSMLRLVDGATCQRCESTARAVVAAQERASGPETPQGHPSEGTGVPGPHGAAQAADLTPAEQAAADALADDSECSWHHGCDAEDCHEPRARAVVAAVRGPIAAEALREVADGTRFPSHWILFRRNDGSGVTVSDLLRETAARHEGTTR